MRKRKFLRMHLFGTVATIMLTTLMVLATPSNGFGGEWLPLIAYIVYVMCDWHERSKHVREKERICRRS